LFPKIINGVEIHQVAFEKLVASNFAGRFVTRIENISLDIEFSGVKQEHFAKLSATENS
jgi:hypothetical protein